MLWGPGDDMPLPNGQSRITPSAAEAMAAIAAGTLRLEYYRWFRYSDGTPELQGKSFPLPDQQLTM